jgi:hypothetical protein
MLNLFSKKISNKSYFILGILGLIYILTQYKVILISDLTPVNIISSNSDTIQTKCNYSENGPRILCAIFTHKSVHKTTLPPVHNTWAKRCDKVIYMTGPKSPDQNDDPTMPFVYLNITDIYDRITDKTFKTMEYIYENLMNEFDWFLRANDDTFIIMENLRLFLANKCANELKIYGKVLNHYRHKG